MFAPVIFRKLGYQRNNNADLLAQSPMFSTLLTKPQHWIRTTPRESWRIFVLCLESRRVRRLRRLQELIIQAFRVWWWHRHRCRLCRQRRRQQRQLRQQQRRALQLYC